MQAKTVVQRLDVRVIEKINRQDAEVLPDAR